MLKRRWKSVIALGLSVTMMAAASGSVLAANGINTGTTAKDVKLTKKVKMLDDSMDVPNPDGAAGYEFVFEPGAVLDSTTAEVSPDLVNTAHINNKFIITFGSSDAKVLDTNDNYYYATKESAAILAETVFPHAGVYSYTVTETAGTTAVGTNGTITYSQAEYVMTVYVKNDDGLTGATVIDSVTFLRTKDDNGTPITADLGDPLKPGAKGEKADPVFINGYTEITGLEISKKVTGTYADLKKDFGFSLTLSNPANAADNTVYKAYVYDDVNNVPVSPEITKSFTVGTADDFVLKANQSLRFVDDAGEVILPVGIKYTLTEGANANYAPAYAVTTGGNAGPTGSANKNNSLTIGNPDLVIIEKGVNKAAWTNNYVDPPTPTGIVMDNLPFIMLILVAVGGFAGYIISKRRKAGK